jgi:IS30 family transposase
MVLRAREAKSEQPILDAAAAELNSRPRKTLGRETPAERLPELLAA